jgi:hypothetical protein
LAYRNLAPVPTAAPAFSTHTEHIPRTAAAFQLENAMKPENRVERFTTHWQRNFKDEPYYSEKYSWDDFDPAYRYAYRSYEENPHARFEDLETRLEAGWDIAKGKSKLAWVDAKEAIKSAWHSVERVLPGDADRDGR